MRFLSHFLISIFCSLSALAAPSYPVTYQSCGEAITTKAPPQRAIAIDINTTEIMLALGLGSRLVATAGIENEDQVSESFRSAFRSIPAVRATYPNLEALLAYRPDFVFAGWQYGFSESSGVTPRRLSTFKVGTYALRESCIRVGERENIQLASAYSDIRTIAQIFGVEQRGEILIRSFQEREAKLRKQASRLGKKRIFVYDSGEATPFTAGRYGMPTAILGSIGMQNVFDDVASNWVAVSWEDVALRKPEFVVIVDYGAKNAAEKKAFLQRKLSGKGIEAIEKQHILALPYAAVIPGVRNLDAAEQLLEALQKAFPLAGT